jgi:hypothetical protein
MRRRSGTGLVTASPQPDPGEEGRPPRSDSPGPASGEARDQVLGGACSACLEGSHAGCGGRTTAFGGPCACQADGHRVLLAAPATAAELDRIYAGLPARPRAPQPVRRSARPAPPRGARPRSH